MKCIRSQGQYFEGDERRNAVTPPPNMDLHITSGQSFFKSVKEKRQKERNREWLFTVHGPPKGPLFVVFTNLMLRMRNE